MVKKTSKKNAKSKNPKVSKEVYNQIKEEVEKKYKNDKKSAKIKASALNLLGTIFLIAPPFTAMNFFTGFVLALACWWASRSIKQYYMLI